MKANPTPKPSAREKQILSETLKLLKKELLPRRIILFGSRAKGRARPGSDFDLAVDARAPLIAKKRFLNVQIEEIAGLHRVDLVYLSQISKGFRNLIEKTGTVVYER